MVQYPIRIKFQRNLNDPGSLDYLIKIYKGCLLSELKRGSGKREFIQSVPRSHGYEIDLLQDALNLILNNAKSNFQSINFSAVLYRLLEEITLHKNYSFKVVLKPDGTFQLL
jgi:hypothetical protein